MKPMRQILLLAIIISSLIAKGQTTWNEVSNPGTNLIIVDETTGYFYFNEDIGSHGMKYTLMKVTNDFETFTPIKSQYGEFGCYHLDEMFFLDADTGFIAELCQGNTSILKTTDGGQNWEDTGFGGSFGLSMSFLRANFGYYSFCPGDPNLSYVNQNETQVFSTDEYTFTNDNYEDLGISTKIKFLNDSTGFLISKDKLDRAVILKTINYGYYWSEVKVVDDILFKDIYFVSDVTGFVIGTNGGVYKTTNGGEEWNLIDSYTSNTLNSIDFSDDGVGYIVGDNGSILKSLDMGETWTQNDFANANDLIYVRVFGNSLAYINDADGTLYSNRNNLSVIENGCDDILVYPNPVSDVLNISIPTTITQYKIDLFDLQGKKLLSSNEDKFSVAHLLNGIYILEVKSKQGVYRKKIIIK
ncbi:MAG: T9SS type A sorting domain-containing protein [Bacteroidales bacterium]|nr:T9SS type A sorting domain-containing protein [Bacteroidales bacterium]